MSIIVTALLAFLLFVIGQSLVARVMNLWHSTVCQRTVVAVASIATVAVVVTTPVVVEPVVDVPVIIAPVKSSVPNYHSMQWNELRSFAKDVLGSAKGKKIEILKALDAHFQV